MTFLNETELIFCTQLNGFKYFFVTRIILFNINHLFVDSEIIKSILFNITH